MELEHNERDGCRWQVARRLPAPALRPLLGQALEGWAWEGQSPARFHELPFPGIPLILNLAAPWRVEGTNLDSFLAGLHTRPTTVGGERAFSCVELRLTPLGTRRLLGLPLHEVTDRSVPLEELLPGAETLAARLRDAPDWEARFDLVESFLDRRLADSAPPPHELEWAWRELVRSGGRVRVRALARELGWSPRRLIDRFRDHVGLPPKAVARVIRFNRAVTALSSGTSDRGGGGGVRLRRPGPPRARRPRARRHHPRRIGRRQFRSRRRRRSGLGSLRLQREEQAP